MIISMTPITSAMWISPPKALKANNPNNHKTKRIMPIVNKMDMLPPLYLSVRLTVIRFSQNNNQRHIIGISAFLRVNFADVSIIVFAWGAATQEDKDSLGYYSRYFRTRAIIPRTIRPTPIIH